MRFRIILLVSLMANLGLVAAYVLTRKEPSLAAASSKGDATIVTNRARGEQRVSRVFGVIESTNAFHWGSVESEDYRQYIENLRAIGCPEETIRDIIIADVNKLFASRVAGLYPKPQEYRFWRVEDQAARKEEREREQKRRALEKEKHDLIKELLGVDYDTAMARWSGRPDDETYRYGFLTAEKQQAVKDLQAKYREQERALLGDGGPGGRNPETRAKIAALRAQREAEMAQVLGPADFEEYQLRNSFTARNMRENLASFQPNEEEFRKIFEMRKNFDDQFGVMRDGGDEALREQRRAAQQQLEEQIRATLGDQRYKDYQLAQDDRYREIYDFAARNNLSADVASTVYETRKAAETARETIMRNRELTQDERNAALTQIALETRNALKGPLGDSYAQYERNDGRWLRNLSPNEGNRRGPPGGGGQGNGPGGGRNGRFFRNQ